MSRTQKLKGLFAALLRVKTLNDNPYIKSFHYTSLDLLSTLKRGIEYSCGFPSKLTSHIQTCSQ